MTVAILYFRDTNQITDFANDVINISGGKIDFIGGYIEGWDDSKISVIAVNDFTIDVRNNDGSLPTKFLIDANGNEYIVGDQLPDGLVDVKGQFIKENPSEVMEQRLQDMELMLLDVLFK